MFTKLLAIVLTLGLTGIGLLVLRQQRIDAAHQMSTVHRRLVQHEAALWQFRSQLVELIRPEIVRDRLQQINDQWSPIPAPDADRTHRPAAALNQPRENSAHGQPDQPARHEQQMPLPNANRMLATSSGEQ